MGLLKKYKTFNNEVRSSLSQVSPELQQMMKRGKLPLDAQSFLDQLSSGELAKKAGVSGANKNIQKTLFGNFKKLLADGYTEIADEGQKLLAPVQDAMNKIYFGLRQTFRKVSNDLVTFGNGGLLGALTKLADKTENFAVKLFRQFLPAAQGWWKRTGDGFKALVNDFKDARDFLSPLRKGGSEVIHMFGKPLGQVFKSLRDNVQHLADLGVKNGPKFQEFGSALQNIVKAFFSMGQGFKEAFTTALPVLTRIVNAVASLMNVIGSVLGVVGGFGSAGGTAAVLGGLYLAHKGKSSFKNASRGKNGKFDAAYGIREVTQQSQIGNGLPFIQNPTELPNTPLSGASGQMSAALQPGVSAMTTSAQAQMTASSAMESAASTLQGVTAAMASGQFGSSLRGGQTGGQVFRTGKIKNLPARKPGQTDAQYRQDIAAWASTQGGLGDYLERQGSALLDKGAKGTGTPKARRQRAYEQMMGITRSKVPLEERGTNASAARSLPHRVSLLLDRTNDPAERLSILKSHGFSANSDHDLALFPELKPSPPAPAAPAQHPWDIWHQAMAQNDWIDRRRKRNTLMQSRFGRLRLRTGARLRSDKAWLKGWWNGSTAAPLGGSAGGGVTGALSGNASSAPVTDGINQGMKYRLGRKFLGQNFGTEQGGGFKGAIGTLLGLPFGGDGPGGRTSAFREGYLNEKEKYMALTGKSRMTMSARLKATKGGLKNSMTGLGGIAAFGATSFLDSGWAKKHIDPAAMGSLQAGAGLLAVNPMLGLGVGLSGFAKNAKTTKGGALMGAASGAAMGAAVGSFIPFIGTGIGAAVGALVGAGLGYFSAKKNQKKFAEAGAKAVNQSQIASMLAGGMTNMLKTGTTTVMRQGLQKMQQFSIEYNKEGQTPEGRKKLLAKYKNILTPDQMKEMVGGIHHGDATRAGQKGIKDRTSATIAVATRAFDQFDTVMRSLMLSTGMTAEEIQKLALDKNVNLYDSTLKLNDVIGALGVGMMKTSKQLNQALSDVAINALSVFDEFTKTKEMTDAIQSAGDRLRGGDTSTEAFLDYYTKSTQFLNFKNPNNPIANYLKKYNEFANGTIFKKGGILEGVSPTADANKYIGKALTSEQSGIASTLTSQLGASLTAGGFNFQDAGAATTAINAQITSLLTKAAGGDKDATAKLTKLQNDLTKTDLNGNLISVFKGKTPSEIVMQLTQLLGGGTAGYLNPFGGTGGTGATWNNLLVKPETAGTGGGAQTPLEKEIESGFMSAINKGLMDVTRSPQWWDDAPKWWSDGMEIMYDPNDKSKVIGLKPGIGLAEGGIVNPTPGGRSYTIGEAGQQEAVIPLGSSKARQALAVAMAGRTLQSGQRSYGYVGGQVVPPAMGTVSAAGLGSNGDINVTIHVNATGSATENANQIKRVLMEELKTRRRRQ